MESVKRAWVSPVAGVQEFVPYEYCYSCGNISNNWSGSIYLDYQNYKSPGKRDRGESFENGESNRTKDVIKGEDILVNIYKGNYSQGDTYEIVDLLASGIYVTIAESGGKCIASINAS